MGQEEKVKAREDNHLAVPTERIMIKCTLNNKPISEDEARRIVVRGAVEIAAKKQTERKKKRCKNLYSA
ncbi:MAG: hypothetical protein K6T66_14495 [Peptococcaceae bacterium]|nr:hypothetical protein [Peptococcaceae bacterium]